MSWQIDALYLSTFKYVNCVTQSSFNIVALVPKLTTNTIYIWYFIFLFCCVIIPFCASQWRGEIRSLFFPCSTVYERKSLDLEQFQFAINSCGGECNLSILLFCYGSTVLLKFVVLFLLGVCCSSKLFFLPVYQDALLYMYRYMLLNFVRQFLGCLEKPYHIFRLVIFNENKRCIFIIKHIYRWKGLSLRLHLRPQDCSFLLPVPSQLVVTLVSC